MIDEAGGIASLIAKAFVTEKENHQSRKDAAEILNLDFKEEGGRLTCVSCKSYLGMTGIKVPAHLKIHFGRNFGSLKIRGTRNHSKTIHYMRAHVQNPIHQWASKKYKFHSLDGVVR